MKFKRFILKTKCNFFYKTNEIHITTNLTHFVLSKNIQSSYQKNMLLKKVCFLSFDKILHHVSLHYLSIITFTYMDKD